MNARMFANQEEMKLEAASRLKLARASAGFRSANAAATKFGWKSTYGAHENGTNGFSPADAQKYGAAFNVNWHWLMLVSEKMEPDPDQLTAAPTLTLTTDAKERIPVFDAAAGGSGHLIVSTEASEFVEAPPILRNINGVYGIRVTGDSMAPDYADGRIAFVNPASGKRSGRPHIFYDHDPKTGEAQAIIKTFLGQTETKWKVAQTNPAKTFTLNKVDWPICHFVAASYN